MKCEVKPIGFRPITVTLTFETESEIIAFLRFHQGALPEVDGLSTGAYKTISEGALAAGVIM